MTDDIGVRIIFAFSWLISNLFPASETAVPSSRWHGLSFTELLSYTEAVPRCFEYECSMSLGLNVGLDQKNIFFHKTSNMSV